MRPDCAPNRPKPDTGHAPVVRTARRAGGPRRALALLSGLVGLVGLAAAPAQAERGPRQSGAVPASETARVIVQYKSDRATVLAGTVGEGRAPAVEVRRAATLAQRHGLALSDGITIAPRMQVLHASGLSSEALKRTLETDSTVEAVWIDQRRRAHAAPSDPLYAANQTSTTPVSGQWYLRAPAGEVVSSINAENAWAVTSGSSSVVVAVLDTGVRRDHPDLASKLLPGYDFISDTATANDGDGRDSDPSDPGDWITALENASGTFKDCGAASSSWHGTQTAGLVGAATNNGIGMAAIGRNVMVLPVRVLGKCGGYDSDIIAAMRWAAGQSVSGVPTNTTPAKVVSLSLGSADTCSSAYTNVIAELEAQNVAVVVSAGNDSLKVNAPANCAHAIAVGGLRHTGTKNGFASLGPEVTVSAPAGNCVNGTGPCLYPILSTYNSGINSPGAASYTTSGSDYAVGTSFSAPQVAGTLGLMYSQRASLTSAQARCLIKRSARAFPTTPTSLSHCAAGATTEQDECLCTTTTCGAGMLDAGAAVSLIAAKAQSFAADFHISSTSIAPNNAVELDAHCTLPVGGDSVSSYEWSLTRGSDLATLVSQGATATLNAYSTGTVEVTLKVTTAAGTTASSAQTLTISSTSVNDASVGTFTPAGTSTSSSGGGAASPVWLIGLLAAAWQLHRVRRIRQPRRHA